MNRVCTVLEKGEYSILVADEVHDVIAVTADCRNFRVPKETIASPSGSIFYFDKKVETLFEYTDFSTVFCIESLRAECI